MPIHGKWGPERGNIPPPATVLGLHALEKGYVSGALATGVWTISNGPWRYEPINLNVRSIANKLGVRRGTRIPCEIANTLASVDPAHPFSELCLIILVNPQGCAARFGHPLEVGSAVRLEGLPASTSVTARVVNCISMGEYERLWLLGLALDEPGDVWGIQSPPQDWTR